MCAGGRNLKKKTKKTQPARYKKTNKKQKQKTPVIIPHINLFTRDCEK